MLNIDTPETQGLMGCFVNYPEKKYVCMITFNRYRLWEGKVVFDGYTPELEGNDCTEFRLKSGDLLFLKIRFHNMDYNETIYRIDKIETSCDKVSENIMKSGLIRLLPEFSGREFQLMGINVKVKRHSSKFSFFECSSETALSNVAKLKLVAGLSIYSNTSVRISEECLNGSLTISDKKSSSCELIYYGNGRFFPLSIKSIEECLSLMPLEALKTFYFTYTEFIRTPNKVHQLYRGCAILDYFIELFQVNAGLYIKNIKGGKSKVLLEIFSRLELAPEQYKYLEKLFIGLDFSAGINKNIKLEFYELRDKLIHRGYIFEDAHQLPLFAKCLMSLNEVIRMLVPHLYLIRSWGFNDCEIYPTLSAEKIINARKEFIPWREVMSDMY